MSYITPLPLVLDSNPWELRHHQYPKHHYEVNPLDPCWGMSPTQIQLLSSALGPILAVVPAPTANEAVKHKNWCQLTQQLVGKDGFQVHMDIQQFKPSEITVKVIDDYAVVEANHEDREDEHGIISRNLKRKYKLPKGYDPNHVTSTLSSDGLLTIKAPLPPKNECEKNIRVVQIQQTGPAHLNIKDNSKLATQNGDKAEN